MAAKVISTKKAQSYLQEYNDLRGKKYHIDARLGSGGTATVFRLKNVHPSVAVKISEPKLCSHNQCELRGAQKGRIVCSHEIKMMERVGTHPNIVGMLDHEVMEIWGEPQPGKTVDPEWITLMFMKEYVDLNAWAEQKKFLTEEELRQIAIDICKALERCAEKFVFHCDVKTNNIFVEKNGQKPVFLLGDFGSATIVNPHNPNPDLFGYTPGYLAPEIADLREGTAKHTPYGASVVNAAGERAAYIAYDPKLINADVFSLGASLYHMLSLELPEAPFKFGRQERKLLKVSEKFEEIIRKAVRYDPHERYASAKAMRMDLEKLVASPETVVFEFSQFYQAKEYLLSGKLSRAEQIAELGVRAGEARCGLLLAYIHCIRASREAGDCDPEEYRERLKPVMGELAMIYETHKLPMAQFLHGIICLNSGYEAQFAKSMKLAAEKDCVPAMFFWGKILNEQRYGFTGRCPEGRAYIYRAAEAEFQPALRYTKKYCGKYKRDYSAVIDALLQNFVMTQEAEIFEGVVAYL